jgi:hypothetical protein
MENKSIVTSFAKDEDDKKLYSDIIKASKYIGKSKWMKLAAREKIERDNRLKEE